MINRPRNQDARSLTERWPGSDGSQCHVRVWQAKDPAGVVLIVHGLGDHGGRFHDVASVLVEQGLTVYAPDLRGHGLSQGQRGYVDRFDLFLDDIDGYLEHLGAAMPGVPVATWGQSFGALLVLYHALKRQPDLAGVVSSSPALRIAMAAPPWKVLIGRTLGRFFPRLSLKTGLDLGELSDNPDHETEARRDELLHGRITPRTYFGMVDAGDYCLQYPDRLNVPTLIMHGGRDTITDPVATKTFADEASACELREWPEGKHELHQMSNGDQIVQFAAQWITTRMRSNTRQ